MREPTRPSYGDGKEAWNDYWSERKRWRRQQAEASRAGAIEHAGTDDPDDLLLRRMTEHELELVRDHAAKLLLQLKNAGEDAASRYVYIKLWGPVSARLADIADMTYRTRADLEGNGHLANVTHDPVMERRDGTPWSWCCSCNVRTDYYAARAEALEAGGRHIAEHDGAWAHDWSD